MALNKLLRTGFLRMGYDYDYLKKIHTDFYGGGYLFEDEAVIVMALKTLHDTGCRVAVMPDFDMDGISAGCVLYSGLSLLGFNVSLFAPSTRNGYGIGAGDMERLLVTWPDTKAVLTCDVGIGAWDAVAYAQSRDVWVYVTDHHPEKSRTTADAIMDPSRTDDPSPFKGVCGAYVAWHLVRMYAQLAGDARVQELIGKLSLFAALGSIGDAMPVVHDTRTTIMQGIKELNALLDAPDAETYLGGADGIPEAFLAPFKSLRALHFYLLADGKVPEGDMDSEAVAFKYVPLFNSFKRLGGDMVQLYDFLYVARERGDSRLAELCAFLDDQNEERKSTAQELFGQMYGDPRQAMAPYVYLVDAFSGILGPLASKIMERTGMPCMVMRPDGRGGFKGSGRTPSWFDAGGTFSLPGIAADGHEHAFGIGADSPGSLQALATALASACSTQTAAAKQAAPDTGGYLRVAVNAHSVDGHYDLSVTRVDDYDVLMDYAKSVKQFAPYGEGLEEPTFILSFTDGDVTGSRLMGKDKSHLRLDLDHNITLVWFGGAAFLKEMAQAPKGCIFEIVGKPGIDSFRGALSLRFMAEGRL